MKTQKILRILILLVVILGLVACQSGGDSNAETNTPSPTPTQTSLPTPLPYLNVPEDYPTIQEAIDAAQDGDQVVVSPGSYNENIDFKGKSITVRSTDPEDLEVVASTIIDGGSKGSVVTFQNGEMNEARLAGFTINNGSGSTVTIGSENELLVIAGGGILVTGESSPTIEGNVITGNQVPWGGGGIYVAKNSSPEIVDNVITGNLAEDNGGGILVWDNSSPKIEGNEITSNQAQWGGGIAVVKNSSPGIVENKIMDNRAGFGGGIYVYDSSPKIERNEITGNQTGDDGGGILVTGGSSPMIEGNEITGNGGEYGGGINVVGNSTVSLAGNSFSGNQADYGGAVVIQSSLATIEGNSFYDNQASYYGGAIAVAVDASAIIEGNTINGNTSGDYGGGVYVTYESTVTLIANTFSGNESWSGGAIRVESDSVLVRNDPDDNVYQNNQPDDVYYHGGTEEDEAVFEGLAMLGLEADDTAINQMIANILANDPLDPCPVVQRVEDAAGTINPTYLVYISAQPEDFFLVVIHTIDTDMEPYGSALFGTILEGGNGNVIVSAEYPVPEGQTAPNEFEIQVVVPGCEIFTETVSYGDASSSIEKLDPIEEKTLLFEDLFNRSLDPEWALIRLNDEQWNVTEQTGLLKVYLAPTTQGPDSLLLRWITEEDFEIITRVLFEPKRNFQRAGIVIYENRDNFVAIVRAYTDWEGGIGNAIFLDHASPSALSWNDPNYENYETQISSRDDVYLKLRREQDVYTGYYSLDGESWIKIGELISPIEPVSHGLLIGKSDTEIFTLFDFYELHSLD